jgi:hypothetical protein
VSLGTLADQRASCQELKQPLVGDCLAAAARRFGRARQTVKELCPRRIRKPNAAKKNKVRPAACACHTPPGWSCLTRRG